MQNTSRLLRTYFIISLIPIWIKTDIHTYFVDLFKLDPIGTEYNCYKLLTENPIQNSNYVAIPWTRLINKNTLHTVPELKLNDGFTICQHFKFEVILPILRQMGINVLFAPHVEKGKVYEGITVLPFPHNAINGTNPAKTKDILYSFVGTLSAQQVRQSIFKLPKHNDTVIIERKSWGARTVDKAHNQEYRNILSRSRFALCPRGHGASTIRFWEALQAGAIPVVLADTFELPHEFDWSKCIIRIPENDIFLVDEIIREIPIEQEIEMRENCLIAYARYSKENIVSTIRYFFSNLHRKT